MIWDRVEADADLQNQMRAAKHKGVLQIIRSHLQLDQNEKMSDRAVLSRIKALRDEFEEELVSTSVFLLGSSRLDQANLGDKSASIRFGILVPNPNSKLGVKVDAVLALTALENDAVFVTCDTRLAKKCRRQSIEAWDLVSFSDWLESGESPESTHDPESKPAGGSSSVDP